MRNVKSVISYGDTKRNFIKNQIYIKSEIKSKIQTIEKINIERYQGEIEPIL